MELPSRAQVVIVGGGVIGTSIAYHLAHRGITDVVLLERHRLTAGTTWHAAGLITTAGFTDETALWMATYSQDLYRRLEAETGLATGFVPIGHLHLACTPHRQEAMRREQAFQRHFGVETHEISGREVGDMWPMAKVDDVLSAVWNPDDGRANPVDVTMSLAKGARNLGVRIVEGVATKAVTVRDGRVVGVDTDQGPIEADQVVLAAGMWTRELAATAGVAAPLQAAEHYYLLTEPMEGAHRDLPVIEDPDRYAYYREEGGGLLVGLFEPVAAPWKPDGVPHDAAFIDLPPDWDRLGPFVAAAFERVPALAHAGVKQLFCGPESFTHDVHPLLGPAPEVAGVWLAAGLNSLGILLGGGVGALLAEWMVDGQAPHDVAHYHVDRTIGFESSRRFRTERIVDQLGTLFGDGVFPNFQPRSARGIRRSAVHHRLVEQGAALGQSAGFEHAVWFAGPGERPGHPDPATAFTRGRAFEHARAEHHAVRTGVGIFDMSLMAKLVVEGPDACRVLDTLSVSDVNLPDGRVVYTQWLHDGAGVEADLTITRLARDRFQIVASDVIHRRVLAMVTSMIGRLGADAHVTDMTAGISMFTVQGPRSRELLQRVTPDDVGAEHLPYLSARTIEVGYGPVLALRITYVGELGYELYVPADHAVSVYDLLFEAGADLGALPCGLAALGSLRLEKAYRDYGHDLDNTDTPLEAGLGFTVSWDKPVEFVGRTALAAQKAKGRLTRRHLSVRLDDPEPLLFGGEPVRRDGIDVGYLRAGAYGHTLGAAVGLGSMRCADGIDAAWVRDGRFEVVVGDQVVPATASLAPFYDPTRSRILD